MRGQTLFLRGDFTTASTGVAGGTGRVTTIFNHTVPHDFDHREPIRYMEMLTDEQGFSRDFFGMLTAVEMKSLCVLSWEFITVFVTAGVSNPNPEGPGTINIIVYSREQFSKGALLEAIITATEAKAKALFETGHDFTGTTTDEVVVACEGDMVLHEYTGTYTEAGRRIYECVRFGVQEALKRHEGEVVRDEPSFFVFSTIGGEHWYEWNRKNCPYYPCHFSGQRCDFCYCPFYPCHDKSLGHWIETSTDEMVWSCKDCHLVHYPVVADYLLAHPEASIKELRGVLRNKKN